MDIFDHKILCKNCDNVLEKCFVVKNGFKLRALNCSNCNLRTIHPQDEEDYKRFLNLKKKNFRVKMRIVGNSHTISIPKEIVSFLGEQEKMLDDMVNLCFEGTKKLSLRFGDNENE